MTNINKLAATAAGFAKGTQEHHDAFQAVLRAFQETGVTRYWATSYATAAVEDAIAELARRENMITEAIEAEKKFQAALKHDPRIVVARTAMLHNAANVALRGLTIDELRKVMAATR